MNQLQAKGAASTLAAVAIAVAAILLHPWATTQAQGVHHPRAQALPAGIPAPAPQIPTYSLVQAQQHVAYHLVTPSAAVLPGSSTVFVHLHGTGSSPAASITYNGVGSHWAVNVYEAPTTHYTDQVPNAKHITLDGHLTQVASWTAGGTALAEANFQVGPAMWFDVTGFNVPLAKVEAILVNVANHYRPG